MQRVRVGVQHTPLLGDDNPTPAISNGRRFFMDGCQAVAMGPQRFVC